VRAETEEGGGWSQAVELVFGTVADSVKILKDWKRCGMAALLKSSNMYSVTLTIMQTWEAKDPSYRRPIAAPLERARSCSAST
jgi:hypothetical protein